MFRRFTIAFAFLSLASAGAFACAGSGDDGSSDGAGALSGASRKAGTSTGATASDAGGLQVTGDSMFIGDVVLVNDQTLNDDGTQTPTARVIFSSRTGICDRLNQGMTLTADEKMFSVRVKQPAFNTGKTTFTGDTSKSACVYIDNDLICGDSATGASPTGTGTLDLSNVSAGSVAGSVDITVGKRRLQGPFVASACPSGKITNNRVSCGRVEPVSEDSVDDNEGGAPTYGTPPAPSSTANR